MDEIQLNDIRESIKRLENQLAALATKIEQIVDVRISMTELAAQVASSVEHVKRLEESSRERGTRLGNVEASFSQIRKELAEHTEYRGSISKAHKDILEKIAFLEHRPAQQIAGRVNTVITQIIGLIVAGGVGFILSKLF